MEPLHHAEVLLVEGEPVAGCELERHVVPAPLRSRRVLASDGASLRAALDGPVVAVVVDGRLDAAIAARTVAAVRALPGGRELPVVALAPADLRGVDVAAGDVRESGERIVDGWWADPHVDVVPPPHALAAIQARLRLRVGAAGRAPASGGRLRSA
jgi:hypothetical protein